MPIHPYLITIAGMAFAVLGAPQQRPAASPPVSGIEAVAPLPAHTPAMRPLTLAPDEVTKDVCAGCHEDAVASFDRSEHSHAMAGSGSECSSCHGDATAHVEAGGGEETMLNPRTELSAQARNDVCLTCHETAGEQGHSRLSEHTRAGVSCIDCHNVHPTERTAMTAHRGGRGAMTPTTEMCTKCHSKVAAEFAMPSRHRLHEGALDCSSCHNVHGTSSTRQLRGEGESTCLECHQDKRGPFMFEHEAGNLDGCVACHMPHGSPARQLLRERDPRALCLSCHSREMGKGVPHGRASTTTMGDCTRCHTAVHGSNVDPYLLH